MRSNAVRIDKPIANHSADVAAREVMDIRQASEYLGISTDSLYRYASEGTIPGFRLGNRWRFRKSRLDSWMDEQSEPTRPRAARSQGKKPVRAVR